MIHSLDREAGSLGVTRQSIIKVWTSEQLDPAQRDAMSHAYSEV